MARVQQHITAPLEDVYRVLANGWLYPHWVLGGGRVLLVDKRWPDKGSVFLHSLGKGPLRPRDVTQVLECVPNKKLVLKARAWPTGSVTVTITLAREGSGTRVTLEEIPERGLVRLVHRSPFVWALKLRNLEMLHRLCHLAEHTDAPGGCTVLV